MRRYVLPIILTLALVVTGVWGYNQQQQKKEYQIFLNNQYQRMYYDMIGSVESITADLSKLMISSQTRRNVVLYSKVWRNAYNAQEKLSQLPIRHAEITKTEKFLSQVGDYTFALAQRDLAGEKNGENEYETLEKLHNYAATLSENLHDLQKTILKGNVWEDDLRRKGSKKLNRQAKEDNPVQIQFQRFEERMVEYPELIYDGPFSEHVIKGMKPRLQGEKISEEEAKKKVIEFVGKGRIDKVEKTTDGRGRIDTYSFEIVPNGPDDRKKNPIYVDISQRNGHVVWILNNRQVEKANISPKQAIKKASKFLEDRGYKNMMPTYTLKYDGTVLINYVYKQDDVIMYPDLIKVKIALDTGDVVGFDATPFLTTNYQRDIQTPKLTAAQAQEKISIRAKVMEEGQLCIIPTDSFGEILCYEFKTKYKEDTFLVYINANTGEEERILKTVISENGTLMI